MTVQITHLNDLREHIKETEDVVAHEVVVAVVVLVLSSQEERLAELPRVHVGDGDGTRHHEEHSAYRIGRGRCDFVATTMAVVQNNK